MVDCRDFMDSWDISAYPLPGIAELGFNSSAETEMMAWPRPLGRRSCEQSFRLRRCFVSFSAIARGQSLMRHDAGPSDTVLWIVEAPWNIVEMPRLACLLLDGRLHGD